MKKGLILYYSGILIFFIALLFSVRYIVNTTRIFLSYEDGFNPILIKWEFDKSDSTLRVKDPLHIRNEYYLVNYNGGSFSNKNHVTPYEKIFNDSVKKQGNFLSLKPPYYIWKERRNDTLKVFKSGIVLNL